MKKWIRTWQNGKKPEHLTLRLAALVLAIILWIIASGRPPQTVGHDTVELTAPIEIVNLAEGLTIREMPATVHVTVSGPRLLLIWRGDQTRVLANFLNKGEGTHRMTLVGRASGGLQVRQIDPAAVWAVLEREPTS